MPCPYDNVSAAVDAKGCCHAGTKYEYEEAVGAAVRHAIADGICTHEDPFVTSKLWVTDMKDEATAVAGIDASLERLDIGYLDLYLEHQARNDYFVAWRAIQDALHVGKLRAIGGLQLLPQHPHQLLRVRGGRAGRQPGGAASVLHAGARPDG